MNRDRQGADRGQSLVESTLVLIVFLSMLLGMVDVGQVLVAHQALVERVRGAARWGSLHPYDGTGEQVANLVLYNQPTPPPASPATFLGLTRANVDVQFRTAAIQRPDDQWISVAVVNYEYHFFSPWLSKPFVNPRPVAVTVPCVILSLGDHPTVPPLSLRR
jgi:Flp pilus assembly protein TadG